MSFQIHAQESATGSIDASVLANTPLYEITETEKTPKSWIRKEINTLFLSYPEDIFTQYTEISKDEIELKADGQIIKLLFIQEGPEYLEHKEMLQSNEFDLRQISDATKAAAYKVLNAKKVEWLKALGENIYYMETAEFLAIIQNRNARQLILLWNPDTKDKVQISIHSHDSDLAFKLLSGISFKARKYRIQRSTRSSVPDL